MTISTPSTAVACAALTTHVLRQSALLQRLDASLGEAVAAAMINMGSHRVLAAEQTYQQQADPVTHVSIVLSGYLLVGVADVMGKAHIVRPLGAGQPFNVLPVLDGGPAIHDAHAGPETTLLRLPKGPFLQLMQDTPAFGHAVHALLFARNRQLYQELADMALLPLRQRCARLILQMMEDRRQLGSNRPDWCVSVSQTELAGMLGYTRPIVNKALRKLADEGLIQITYRHITVTNLVRMEQVALSQNDAYCSPP